MSTERGGIVRLIKDAASLTGLKDWGPVPEMIEGRSDTSGVLLYRGPAGESECGVWQCTPGTWRLEVESDEFCHFLAGRCVYTSEGGERVEIAPGDVALFPAGWKGTCEVIETVRKVYMIR